MYRKKREVPKVQLFWRNGKSFCHSFGSWFHLVKKTPLRLLQYSTRRLLRPPYSLHRETAEIHHNLCLNMSRLIVWLFANSIWNQISLELKKSLSFPFCWMYRDRLWSSSMPKPHTSAEFYWHEMKVFIISTWDLIHSWMSSIRGTVYNATVNSLVLKYSLFSWVLFSWDLFWVLKSSHDHVWIIVIRYWLLLACRQTSAMCNLWITCADA